MKINWNKSLYFGLAAFIDSPIHNARDMIWIPPNESATYLGLQVSGSMAQADKTSWKKAIAKIQNTADKWSRRLLNWSDKRTVIIYLLTSIIWYRVPVIVVSNKQIKELTKIISKFFIPNKQIAWEILTRPFAEGGFDLPNIPDRIRRLQGKLKCRLYEGRSQPWKLCWRKILQISSKTKDARLIFPALLEPSSDQRDTSQITSPPKAWSPLIRQNFRYIQAYATLNMNYEMSLDQILALPATPSKTLNTFTNNHGTRGLIRTNHYRINNIFNEDTRNFFTARELSRSCNIRQTALTPIIESVHINIPIRWLETLLHERRRFQTGDWVLLENADPDLARTHLFKIDSTDDTSATLTWARPDPFLEKDNLFWLVPTQQETQPLNALSHARVHTLPTSAGRTAVLYLGEEEKPRPLHTEMRSHPP